MWSTHTIHIHKQTQTQTHVQKHTQTHTCTFWCSNLILAITGVCVVYVFKFLCLNCSNVSYSRILSRMAKRHYTDIVSLVEAVDEQAVEVFEFEVSDEYESLLVSEWEKVLITDQFLVAKGWGNFMGGQRGTRRQIIAGWELGGEERFWYLDELNDGRIAASANLVAISEEEGDSLTVRVWDMWKDEENEVIKVGSDELKGFNELAMSSEFVALLGKECLKVWELEGCEIEMGSSDATMSKQVGSPCCIALHRDRLAVMDGKPEIRVWNAATGAELWSIKAFAGPCYNTQIAFVRGHIFHTYRFEPENLPYYYVRDGLAKCGVDLCGEGLYPSDLVALEPVAHFWGSLSYTSHIAAAALVVQDERGPGITIIDLDSDISARCNSPAWYTVPGMLGSERLKSMAAAGQVLYIATNRRILRVQADPHGKRVSTSE